MLNWKNLIKNFNGAWVKAKANLTRFIKKKELNALWFKNVFSKENTRHRFHLVSPSPWPLLASLAATSLLVGLLFWLHLIITSGPYHHPFLMGCFLVIVIMFVWFRDIIREGVYLGYHTKIVQKGLKIGFILFLISEIMFFFCLFWAYFHSSLNPSIWIGGIWPPEGIIHFYLNEGFNNLFQTFHQPTDVGHLWNSAFTSPWDSESYKTKSLSQINYTKQLYFPIYDPTMAFDRMYLFYQNMFFYTPSGKIPMTYHAIFEDDLLPDSNNRATRRLLDENDELNIGGILTSADRVGSGFSTFYSPPYISVSSIDSKTRYEADKYIFFLVFVREILKETSIYFSFLEFDIVNLTTVKNHLDKKINNIFLNLFYKFYQAPVAIDYWTTLKHSGEKEIFVVFKPTDCEVRFYNNGSFSGEDQPTWPKITIDPSAILGHTLRSSDGFKETWMTLDRNVVLQNCIHGPKWSCQFLVDGIHNGLRAYFHNMYNSMTYHFLDSFHDDSSVLSGIGPFYKNILSIDFSQLNYTEKTIYEKIKIVRNFFLNNVNGASYESRYFLENFDVFFGFEKKKTLTTDNLVRFNIYKPENMLLASDIRVVSENFFNEKTPTKNGFMKKILHRMFGLFSEFKFAELTPILFFSNKNYQLQLKHFYSDLDSSIYKNSPKITSLVGTKKTLLNLNVTESKVENYANFFRYINTINNEMYKNYSIELDPLVAGAKIYSKIHNVFANRSKLFVDYDFKWFKNNVNWIDEKTPRLKKFKHDYSFLNRNYFTHFYTLPNLILRTFILAKDCYINNNIMNYRISGAFTTLFTLLECSFDKNNHFQYHSREVINSIEKIKRIPFFLFSTYWETYTGEYYRHWKEVQFKSWHPIITDFSLFQKNVLSTGCCECEINKINAIKNPDFVERLWAQIFNNEETAARKLKAAFKLWDYCDTMPLYFRKRRFHEIFIFPIFYYFFQQESTFAANDFNLLGMLSYFGTKRTSVLELFVNEKINLYYRLYDFYMGGMSTFFGRYTESYTRKFQSVYFILSVFDKGLLIDPNKIPWINTVILITSGFSVTVSHVYYKAKFRKFSLIFLILTIALAIFFLKIQMLEYIHASFAINDGIYGSIFYMLTGFHGFHVLVGTIFLIVCFFRILLKHYISSRHIGFEFAIWYWHFVDVIWIGLYFFVYYWPNNYFFSHHRLWHNSLIAPTDGVADYSCTLHYPISDLYNYILEKNKRDELPYTKIWMHFKWEDTNTQYKQTLFNHKRKLMSLCKYDCYQRENLLLAIFVNPLNVNFMYEWDTGFAAVRSTRKGCIRDHGVWSDAAELLFFYKKSFKQSWHPWWYISLELILTGKTLTLEKDVYFYEPTPYWD